MEKKAGNKKNLTSMDKLTPEERKKRASAGGKARAEKLRQRRAMKEQLDLLLQLPVSSTAGVNALLKNGINDPELADNQAALMAVALNKALSGKIEFMEFIRDTVGEKPASNLTMDATVKTISEEDRRLLERVEKRLKKEQTKADESS